MISCCKAISGRTQNLAHTQSEPVNYSEWKVSEKEERKDKESFEQQRNEEKKPSHERVGLWEKFLTAEVVFGWLGVRVIRCTGD